MIKGTIKIITERKGAKVKTKKVPYSHPEIWDEVTFGQWLAMIEIQYSPLSEEVKILNMLELFTGIPVNDWRKATADQQDIILRCLSFINSPNNWQDIKDIPKYFTFNGIDYEIPKDLEQIPYGSMQGIKSIIESEILMWNKTQEDKEDEEKQPIPEWKLIQHWAKIVALVMQPVIDESLNMQEQRVKRLTSNFQDVPVNILYPIASFFLSKAMRFLIDGAKGSVGNTQQMKSVRGWNRWKSLVHSFRSTR